jgi:hypothetical protein
MPRPNAIFAPAPRVRADGEELTVCVAVAKLDFELEVLPIVELPAVEPGRVHEAEGFISPNKLKSESLHLTSIARAPAVVPEM